MVFLSVITLRFCCSHPRISQGRGSVRGKPLRVSPLAFNHPPAGDRFCAAKVLLQKRKTPMWVSFFFGAGDEARLATGIPRMAEPFAGALPDLLIQRASRRSRQRVQACPRHIPKRIPHPIGWGILFGAGDEARTRYLDLGKVALYQMSYARRRHHYCSAYGASGRGRTGDTRIFSPLLYQLSYRGIWRPRRGSNPRPPA